MQLTTGDMCAYGMHIQDAEGVAPVRKETSWLTNSPCIAVAVSKKCVHKAAEEHDNKHRHASTK